MPQIGAHPAAQIQPDAAGVVVQAAQRAGIALFEDAGQLLRRDAHAGIPDAQGGALLQHDGNAAGGGVFQSVLGTYSHP